MKYNLFVQNVSGSYARPGESGVHELLYSIVSCQMSRASCLVEAACMQYVQCDAALLMNSIYKCRKSCMCWRFFHNY